MTYITFNLRLGGVLTLKRSDIVGVEIPDPRITSVNFVLDSGARVYADMSYQDAMAALEKFDAPPAKGSDE